MLTICLGLRSQHGFGKGEAFGRDVSGQVVKYFAECFAPTEIGTNPRTYFLTTSKTVLGWNLAAIAGSDVECAAVQPQPDTFDNLRSHQLQ
jgi:hypothetical protein